MLSYDLLCLSHLRWDYVYQRPQHLMERAAHQHRVFFLEEPIFGSAAPHLDVTERPQKNVEVLVPHLPAGLPEQEQEQIAGRLLSEFLSQRRSRSVFWYYTPMMLPWTAGLVPLATVYDCMDELSAFAGAPPLLKEREAQLFAQADLVFTGGQTLYEAKRVQHSAVYAFPSSVDVPFFASARTLSSEPDDQQSIPHPRLGFYGVLDERFDIDLLRGVSALRPDWQWIIVGPVHAKIDAAALPQGHNIHYLGSKGYPELPAYLAGWDAALLLFARNDATRFISPTKTPEYLAAGKPVVSTSIRDVVRPYGELGLARIADTPEAFVAACEAALAEDAAPRIQKADQYLSRMSWDKTWEQMAELIATAIAD